MDFGSFYHFPRLVNSLLEEMGSPASAFRCKGNFPPINISESDDAVIITALIPGADIDDVELLFTGGLLSIKGEIPAKQGHYHRQERPTGPFSRVVNINIPIEQNRITAAMKDGVLVVNLPKFTAAKARIIQIELR